MFFSEINDLMHLHELCDNLKYGCLLGSLSVNLYRSLSFVFSFVSPFPWRYSAFVFRPYPEPFLPEVSLVFLVSFVKEEDVLQHKLDKSYYCL